MGNTTSPNRLAGAAPGSKVVVRKRGALRRLIAFVGPAYPVSVGYMDPGNWATDIEGGARFGYMLIWVLLMSNLMAMLLQTLAARLGIVTGRDLAQGCRRAYPRSLNSFLWVLAEMDMLVMGSHGHRGLDDLVFGQTVSSVRHAVAIPFLVVRSYGRERAQRSRLAAGRG